MKGILVVFVTALVLVVATGFLSKAKADGSAFESSLVPTTSMVTFTEGNVAISGENGGQVELYLDEVTDTSTGSLVTNTGDTLVITAVVNGSPTTFTFSFDLTDGYVDTEFSLGLSSGDTVQIVSVEVNDPSSTTFAAPGVVIGSDD